MFGFPGGARDARDVSSVPGLGRCPGEGNGNLLQYSCLENPIDRGGWWAYSPCSHKESDTIELHTYILCLAELPWMSDQGVGVRAKGLSFLFFFRFLLVMCDYSLHVALGYTCLVGKKELSLEGELNSLLTHSVALDPVLNVSHCASVSLFAKWERQYLKHLAYNRGSEYDDSWPGSLFGDSILVASF